MSKRSFCYKCVVESGDEEEKFLPARDLCSHHYREFLDNRKKEENELEKKDKVRKFRDRDKGVDFNTSDLSGLKMSTLKRIADYHLRQYLLRHADKDSRGRILCPIKDKYYPQDKVQVAHYIDRMWINTRYDLDNVKLISSDSNMWDAQQPDPLGVYKSKHHADYVKLLGEKKAEELLHKSKEMIIFEREDYETLINKFKNRNYENIK